MKTSGASRKKASQTPPGRAHAAATQPRPRACAVASPSARSAGRRSISSACSISATSSCGDGSGAEELDILFPPADPDLLPLAPAEFGIAIARHFGKHACAPGRQVELDEV